MRTPVAGLQPCAAPHATRDLWVTVIGLLPLLAWDVSGLDLGAARVYG